MFKIYLTSRCARNDYEGIFSIGFQVTGSSSWILDSSASNHMTNSLNDLSNVREYCGSSHIQTANDSVLSIVVFGDISFFL
jgi:hypothetical protein